MATKLQRRANVLKEIAIEVITFFPLNLFFVGIIALCEEWQRDVQRWRAEWRK